MITRKHAYHSSAEMSVSLNTEDNSAHPAVTMNIF